MTDLLDRVRSELRERLAASRAAVEEYERLQAALRALEAAGSGLAASAARPGSGARRAQPTNRGRSRPTSPGGTGRAARGANRDAVVRVIRDRPGVTVAELASASGVAQATVYGVLRRLVDRGEVARRDLPGGQAGYALSGEPRAPAEKGSATGARGQRPATGRGPEEDADHPGDRASAPSERDRV
jgi:hypothetical protein